MRENTRHEAEKLQRAEKELSEERRARKEAEFLLARREKEGEALDKRIEDVAGKYEELQRKFVDNERKRGDAERRAEREERNCQREKEGNEELL